MNTPKGEEAYPQDLETWRTTRSGLKIFLRPIKHGDAPRHKAFLQSLSSQSVYLKFFRLIRPTDEFVGRLVDVDYVHHMAIVALPGEEEDALVLGMGRYILNKDERTAELYFAIRDDYQGQGIGGELVSYIISVARKRGLKGLTAEVMADNRRMLRLFRSFEGKEYRIRIRMEAGIFYLDMDFV
jgi:GNAT superfamily N-acetyltransferase